MANNDNDNKGADLETLTESLKELAPVILMKASIQALRNGARGFAQLKNEFEKERQHEAACKDEHCVRYTQTQWKIVELAQELNVQFDNFEREAKKNKEVENRIKALNEADDAEDDFNVNKLNPRGFKAVA